MIVIFTHRDFLSSFPRNGTTSLGVGFVLVWWFFLRNSIKINPGKITNVYCKFN